ncbi:MAG: DMT family transporter [Pseudolabrys sp.]|nr:DMT family transporter [Pseudolabrys sp.]
MPHAHAKNAQGDTSVANTAKLLVGLLALAWGFHWIAAAIALPEVPPWSLRFAGVGLGAATLFAAARLTGHSLHVPRGERLHVMVAGFLNVAAFQVMSAFAQQSGATSRVVIIVYSMPIWAAVLGRLVLGERLDKMRVLALVLCVGGLSILVWPLLGAKFPPSVFLALGCSLSWASATVYMKWVKATVAPLANAAWQLLFGFLFITVGMLVFDGHPRLWPLHAPALLAVIYIGVFGVGLAHFLWWAIVARLPTVTAAIGSLLVPVVGVFASVIVLGEHPTIPDMAGFVLIFSAAACVLLQPNVKRTEMPE